MAKSDTVASTWVDAFGNPLLKSAAPSSSDKPNAKGPFNYNSGNPFRSNSNSSDSYRPNYRQSNQKDRDKEGSTPFRGESDSPLPCIRCNNPGHVVKECKAKKIANCPSSKKDLAASTQQDGKLLRQRDGSKICFFHQQRSGCKWGERCLGGLHICSLCERDNCGASRHAPRPH
ncbi:hypothetical protein BT69DRAFT_1302075 [Atractiella rhizophila]|nr:hypothetical protein BT69DRAFT_1302075 [Atractiella rhizophila]